MGKPRMYANKHTSLNTKKSTKISPKRAIGPRGRKY